MANENIEHDGQSSEQKDGLGSMFNPADMRVLAIDANVVCLKYLVSLLQRCQYKVTSTTMANEALKILRENNQTYDIVITDVIRLDMDGFKLLEIIGLEMDIPVIMVSAEDDKGSILKGVRHGARDYLIKPVRLQEIKNIWQHVLRKRLLDCCEGSIVTKDAPNKTASLPEPVAKKEDNDHTKSGQKYDCLPCTGKRRRMQWTPELNSKFVDAIQTLEAQNEQIHPKRILQIMNIDGLTRENIASHLQKYRNMLKKREAETSQQTDSHLAASRQTTSTGGKQVPCGHYQPMTHRWDLHISPITGMWPKTTRYGTSSSASNTLQLGVLSSSCSNTSMEGARQFCVQPPSSSWKPVDNYRVAPTGNLAQENGLCPYMRRLPTSFVTHYNAPGSSCAQRTIIDRELPTVLGASQHSFPGESFGSSSNSGVINHRPMADLGYEDQAKPINIDELDIMEMLNQFYNDGSARL